jgi:hypothetical protein
MGLMPDSSPYGSQTVTDLAGRTSTRARRAAAQYEELALKLTGSVVPQQQGQLDEVGRLLEGRRGAGRGR